MPMFASSPNNSSSSNVKITAKEGSTTGATTATPRHAVRQHRLESHYVSLLTKRQPTYIARLICVMQDCLTELLQDNNDNNNNNNNNSNHDDDEDLTTLDDDFLSKLEKMAILIHESMSSSSRNYHSVQHVFDISKDLTDPLAVLAALFHDIIYYNIDGGLTPAQAKILLPQNYKNGDSGGTKPYHHNTISNLQIPMHEVHGDRVMLPPGDEKNEDRLLRMVEDIFGLQQGEGVSFRMGLNEFLSAVIAVRCLESILSLPQLAQIACCIEATIPFRPNDPVTGQSAMDRLYLRMVQVNDDYALGFTDEDVVESVQRAALLANEDISNFGMADRTWFLDNTWSLLPESNESLRHQYLYTVEEFQQAVFKMNGFFNFLQPHVVFSSFRHVPSDEQMESRMAECRRNLQVGKKYVGAKLLSISVLAAFCELTGGDAPMSLFMGDLPSRHHVSCRLEDALPQLPVEDVIGICDRDVYNILVNGRRTETSFDIRQSPMAAYLYGSLGDDGLQRILLEDCPNLYPMTRDVALSLLTALPRDAVTKIAQNMATVAISRSEKILHVLHELPPPPPPPPPSSPSPPSSPPASDSDTNNAKGFNPRMRVLK